MPDAVYDSGLVMLANGSFAGRKRGNLLDRRLAAIELCVRGPVLPRYNSKLVREYTNGVRERRNDTIELFIAVLADKGISVPRNNLTRQEHSQLRRIRWPSHDQHLVAAAMGGDRVTLYSAEAAHDPPSADLKRAFGIDVRVIV